MSTVFEEDLVPIGKIIKSIGFKGVMVVEPFDEYIATWNVLEKCIIRVKGIWAPFFIESKENAQDDLQVKFEEYNDGKTAHEILHENIYVFKHQIILDDTENSIEDEMQAWIGYQVIDVEFGEIGIIEDIEELPGQDVIHLTYINREIVLPFADELIVDIDTDKKIIYMDLPEGILEL